MPVGTPSRDRVLQRLAQHVALHREAQHPVLKRHHPVEVAVGGGTRREVGADAAVVHDRHVGFGDVAHRVRDQTPQPVLVAPSPQVDLDPRNRPAGEVLDANLEEGHQVLELGVGAHAVGVGRLDARQHLAPPTGPAHEVDDRDPGAARARLHDGDPVDDGVHERVGVAAHDQIHRPRIETARDVEDLAVAGGGRERPGGRITAGVAKSSLVRHDDHEARRRPRLRQHPLHRGGPVPEGKAGDVAGRGVGRRRPQRQADHGDLLSPALEQRPRLRPVGARPARRVRDVRGEEAVMRLRHARAQRVHRPVELVVPDRRRVDPERVEGGDGGTPVADVRQQRALHLIAPVEPHGRAVAGARQGVEPRLEGGRAPDGASPGPGPGLRFQRAVQVVDREDPEQDAVLRAGGIQKPGRGKGEGRRMGEEEREEPMHGALKIARAPAIALP